MKRIKQKEVSGSEETEATTIVPYLGLNKESKEKKKNKN